MWEMVITSENERAIKSIYTQIYITQNIEVSAFNILHFCSFPLQYTQQKAHDAGVSSSSWSWGVLESVKAQWNRGVVTLTSALVNEHQQWNGLASWTSTQVKKINDYFKSPPTSQ